DPGGRLRTPPVRAIPAAAAHGRPVPASVFRTPPVHEQRACRPAPARGGSEPGYKCRVLARLPDLAVGGRVGRYRWRLDETAQVQRARRLSEQARRGAYRRLNPAGGRAPARRRRERPDPLARTRTVCP